MIKHKKNLIFVIFFVVILILVNLNRQDDSRQEIKTEVSPYLNSDIQVKTFERERGWGYDITIDGLIYIHQPNIPALPGDAGFKNEKDAKAVAELMVQKIRENILPPGVTVEEVKALISK